MCSRCPKGLRVFQCQAPWSTACGKCGGALSLHPRPQRSISPKARHVSQTWAQLSVRTSAHDSWHATFISPSCPCRSDHSLSVIFRLLANCNQ